MKLIISKKHSIYELPNDWILKILGNQKRSGKSQNLIELYSSAKSSTQKKNFVDTSKKLLKKRNWNFPVVRYFT